MKLIDQAKKLPLSPGVYFFLNKKNEILYIGRAVFLRKRVLNYFQKNIDSRVAEMIRSASNIKFKKTGTLLEAVILEANLIKKHWPKYNVKEKDNRSFIYIVIPKTDYPKPIIVRGRELEKFPSATAKIFGPYQSLSLVKSALKIIRKIFPYSTCLPAKALAKAGRPFSGQPCFYYQIGLCPGLCIGAISKKEYQKNIKNIILLLSGQKNKLIKDLRKENPEKAGALKHIQDVALIAEVEKGWADVQNQGLKRIEAYDISHLSGKETYGSMAVFSGSEPEKSQYRLFKIKTALPSDDLRALEEMVLRRLKHKEWTLPDLILIDGGSPQINWISDVLKSRRLNIPLVGLAKSASRRSGDKLVFPPKTKKSFKELADSIKGILLKSRDEAHRFALKSSRRSRRRQF